MSIINFTLTPPLTPPFTTPALNSVIIIIFKTITLTSSEVNQVIEDFYSIVGNLMEYITTREPIDVSDLQSLINSLKVNNEGCSSTFDILKEVKYNTNVIVKD